MGDLVDILDAIIDGILELLCFPFLGDGMYRRGFLAALVFAFIVGWISRQLVYARAKILVFFADVPPSLRGNPSGYTRMIGCFQGILTIGCLFVVLGSLVIGVLYALAQ